jgi:thermostable 8-oxoguanine DNA glycosylase
MKGKDILDLLGLTNKEITLELTKDLNYVIENGIVNYLQKLKEHENKKQEFIEMFKECYDDIVKIIEFDPYKRIAVDCYTCIRGMDLSKQYGKPLKSYKKK